jgi:hypothetical protein
MKKHFFLFSAIFIAVSVNPSVCQRLIPNRAVTGTCYAGKKTNRIYIPPPARFLAKSGKTGGASITVLYYGLPDNARNAVEYAVSILESLLPDDTHMTMSVSWDRIADAGVLANSNITGYAEGRTIDALNPLAVYPVALAEKIAGRALNDSLDSDIDLSINNNINWYYGTDGNTPGQHYDLVTVVLHEICHGLGFFDSMDTGNNLGWYGIEGEPIIYDTFIENYQGMRLTDTLYFRNHSNDLYRQLTGGNLYFNGPLLMASTYGARARLYAPSAWDSGSSISHLDENTTQEPNTLMTPYIDKGEAIHDPGNVTMSILGDLGWINTRIVHTPPHDTEAHLTSVPLTVRIASDTSYDHNAVCAVYSYNDFISSDTVFMTSAGPGDIYTCTLPVLSYNSGVQYYFFTIDGFGRIYRSPSLSDSIRYSIFVGADTVRPEIIHTPLISFLDRIDTVKFDAVITDNLGVDTAYLEYILNDGQSARLGMALMKDDRYEADLNTSGLHLSGGDSIRYRIMAADSARIPNLGVSPASGYHVIHIEGLSNTLAGYSTDFSGEASEDFIDDGLSVSRPAGFAKYGLNSPHPYESPEDNNKTIEYTSVLRHPLLFSGSGMVFTYNEIVLVEPGESGSVFGSPDFYDYVIVEGSADFGKTWFSLTDGYDSRFRGEWETYYNSSIDGFNSTARATESMLATHSFFYGPSGKIKGGDTMLVRFRLFSDPFANGWGWIVEDLNIHPLVDAAEENLEEPKPVLYPNPGNGLIHISTAAYGSNEKQMHYSILNISGFTVRNGIISSGNDNLIDITGLSPGIYFIFLSRDDWIQTYRYVLMK